MLTLNLDNQAEIQFNKLLKYSGMDFSKLINSMLTYRINELKKGIQNIKNDLVKYENKYNMKSPVFYKSYLKGDFEEDSDSNDFMIWSGEYEVYTEFKEELNQLQ